MEGFIYKYENKINHKIYIGQTTDLSNRKTSHRYKAKFVKSKFYNAVRKYGWSNFNFDIVARVEADTLEKVTELLDTLEVKYIAQYDSFKHGYNSTAGGHCYRGKEVSEEFREYCRHRTYSEETRKKMSEAAHNRKVSDETRRKLSESAKKRKFGIIYREQATEKRNAAIRKAKSKPILQLDMDGNVIQEFPRLGEAVTYIRENLCPQYTKSGIWQSLDRYLKGKSKQDNFYGFDWRLKAVV